MVSHPLEADGKYRVSLAPGDETAYVAKYDSCSTRFTWGLYDLSYTTS